MVVCVNMFDHSKIRRLNSGSTIVGSLRCYLAPTMNMQKSMMASIEHVRTLVSVQIER